MGPQTQDRLLLRSSRRVGSTQKCVVKTCWDGWPYPWIYGGQEHSVEQTCSALLKFCLDRLWCHCCPRNLTDSWLNEHFSGFKVTPSCSNFFSTCSNLVLCSAWVAPNTRISSIWHTVPSSPSSIFFMRFWNSSGALEIPKGSLLKQYHPLGEMKVVNGLDSGARGICQKPLLASSFVKTEAPDRSARVSSTFGLLGGHSHWVALNPHISLLLPTSLGLWPSLHTIQWAHQSWKLPPWLPSDSTLPVLCF